MPVAQPPKQHCRNHYTGALYRHLEPRQPGIAQGAAESETACNRQPRQARRPAAQTVEQMDQSIEQSGQHRHMLTGNYQ